jgi:hypothetical protein
VAAESGKRQDGEADDDVMACTYRPPAPLPILAPFKAPTPEIPFRCRKLVRIAIILSYDR